MTPQRVRPCSRGCARSTATWGCLVHVESVRVHGFGRLCGCEFRFAPGLTIVHGPNEAGKSTLHAALSAALFGLVGSGRRKRDYAARVERFRPWDGGRYAAT